MKPRTRIPRKRATPRRKRPALTRKAKQLKLFLDPRSYVTKGGRVRLFGEDYRNLQWAAYQRSWRNGLDGPRCECGCGKRAWWQLDWDRGELSHNEHGARKSDELHRVKWMRHECHMKSHNAGGKPCPKKEIAA